MGFHLIFSLEDSNKSFKLSHSPPPVLYLLNQLYTHCTTTANLENLSEELKLQKKPTLVLLF